jgi:hypothetical protein
MSMSGASMATRSTTTARASVSRLASEMSIAVTAASGEPSGRTSASLSIQAVLTGQPIARHLFSCEDEL